jgi:hypothetical protein
MAWVARNPELIGFGRGVEAASSQVQVNALRLGATDPGTDPGTPANPNLPNDDSASWPNVPWDASDDGLASLGHGNNGDAWGEAWIDEMGFLHDAANDPESEFGSPVSPAGIQSAIARLAQNNRSVQRTDNEAPIAANLRVRREAPRRFTENPFSSVHRDAPESFVSIAYDYQPY